MTIGARGVGARRHPEPSARGTHALYTLDARTQSSRRSATCGLCAYSSRGHLTHPLAHASLTVQGLGRMGVRPTREASHARACCMHHGAPIRHDTAGAGRDPHQQYSRKKGRGGAGAPPRSCTSANAPPSPDSTHIANAHWRHLCSSSLLCTLRRRRLASGRGGEGDAACSASCGSSPRRTAPCL